MVSRQKLTQAARKLTNARVRRAYETARNGRVPQGIIEDLGLRRVDRVHHISLDFDQLGADAYLEKGTSFTELTRILRDLCPGD